MKTEIHDGSILLRPYRIEDIEVLFAAVRESLDELTRWMPWCHAGYAIEETREFILKMVHGEQEGTDYAFGIFDQSSGLFLGGTGVNQVSLLHRYGNLGYWVRTTAAGRGIATSAARLVARFGFESLGLNRIEILAAVDNLASQRVAAKLGAQREGILRRRLWLQDQAHDAVMHSLVREDLEKLTADLHQRDQ